MAKDVRPNRRYIPALVLALVAPGLGRSIAGSIVPGILLFLLVVLLWQITLSPWWLNAIIKFSLWAFFASIDVGYVVRRMRGE